jgi:hypothetical protein
MGPDSHSAVTANFSVAFESMCSVVAISRTRSSAETLRQLLLQCLVILPHDRLRTAHEMAEVIDALFGLRIPEHEVDTALEALLRDGSVERRPDLSLFISQPLADQLSALIESSRALEAKVKEEWLREVEREYPGFPLRKAWKAVRAYLTGAFRRHGMQAAALLGSGLETAPHHAKSLSLLLDDALREAELQAFRESRAVVTSFLTTASASSARIAYIGQLADGAFNYFSLAAAPDVASELRRALVPLTLFMDTNFLFGILDLHANPQVAVSRDLLRAVAEYSLPFSLVYHERTRDELISTINYYAGALRGKKWPPTLSRAALRSGVELSGIEQRYHQMNADIPTDPEEFIAPYRHADVLLEQKGISVVQREAQGHHERDGLNYRYGQFLSRYGKDKGPDAIDHVLIPPEN